MTNPYPITPRQLDLDKLSGSHLTQQGVYPNIKMGVVASYDVSGGSAETVLKSTASGGITLDSLNVKGNSILRNVLPENTDTYDLGSSINLWRKGWLSELDTIIFAENTAALVGGWLIIGKDQGSIPSFVDSTDVTIDFGKTMTVGGSVVFRSSLQVEYIGTGSLASGSTVYNVVRDLDGSGANDWVEGSVFLELGESGDGRIELNAYDTPRIQLIQQGATYNDQSEIIRIGDLNGNWGYSSSKYGISIGEYVVNKQNIVLDEDGILRFSLYSTENLRIGNLNGAWGYATDEYGIAIGSYSGSISNITIDSTNGLRMRSYDTTVLQIETDGDVVLWKNLKLTDDDAVISIGATPPTTSGSGTGLWIDKTGLYSLNAGTYQVKIDATDGKLYAGGGKVIVDEDGISIETQQSFVSQGSINWLMPTDPIVNSITIGAAEIYGLVGGGAIENIRNELKVYNQAATVASYIQILASNGMNNDTQIILESDASSSGGLAGESYCTIQAGYLGIHALSNGWNTVPTYIMRDYTPVYVSSTSIMFPSVDVSDFFPVGTKLRFYQSSSVRYCYVTIAAYSGGNTTLTLVGTAVTNATIDFMYYSHAAVADTMPFGSSTFIPLTTPLTSTSWDGNDTKTVGTITIDTSSVFGAPAGIKAALIFFRAKWTSASTSSFMYVRPIGATRYTDIIYADNTSYQTSNATVPCDENGDFEFVVGGANATEVICEIWGYWL